MREDVSQHRSAFPHVSLAGVSVLRGYYVIGRADDKRAFRDDQSGRSLMTKRQHIRVPGSASADVIKLIIPRLLPLRAADRC